MEVCAQLHIPLLYDRRNLSVTPKSHIESLFRWRGVYIPFDWAVGFRRRDTSDFGQVCCVFDSVSVDPQSNSSAWGFRTAVRKSRALGLLVTEFWTVVHRNYASSNLFHVTFLVPRNMRWLLIFGKFVIHGFMLVSPYDVYTTTSTRISHFAWTVCCVCRSEMNN